MRSIIIISVMALVSGCATKMQNIHPEWNDPKGYEWTVENCKAQAKAAGGYSPISFYKACMASHGHELKHTGKLGLNFDPYPS